MEPGKLSTTKAINKKIRELRDAKIIDHIEIWDGEYTFKQLYDYIRELETKIEILEKYD